MNANSAARKLLSLILIIGGVVMLVYSLILDFSGSAASYRGPLLVCGMVAVIIGMYLFPTLKYHRRLIYIIFLFPLLFTFAVTVIIPLCLGIFYSFTDWTGIQYTQFVGFGNYISMFQDPQFIWSILMTFVFVVINMILVNLIAFLLALLCTNGIKGDGFFLFDTPGFTSFDNLGLSKDEVADLFPEISRHSGGCRFSDCRHLAEPDCSVKKAVEEGLISATRYESYKTILENKNG